MRTNGINFDKALKNEKYSTFSNAIVNQVICFVKEFNHSVVVQDFYIGTTNYPEKQIFELHRVRPESKKYLIIEAPNEDLAIDAEKTLLALDMNGGFGKSNGRFVYCYYIDGVTKEAI